MIHTSQKTDITGIFWVSWKRFSAENCTLKCNYYYFFVLFVSFVFSSMFNLIKNIYIYWNIWNIYIFLFNKQVVACNIVITTLNNNIAYFPHITQSLCALAHFHLTNLISTKKYCVHDNLQKKPKNTLKPKVQTAITVCFLKKHIYIFNVFKFYTVFIS